MDKFVETICYVFLFFTIAIFGFIVFFGGKLVNYILNRIRIKKLEKMIRIDKNDYQKIFDLLKKVNQNKSNEDKIFRVSYLKTFGNEYRQYQFGSKDNKPFVSLKEMKDCNTLQELETLIDKAKTTIKVIYHITPLFGFDDKNLI